MKLHKHLFVTSLALFLFAVAGCSSLERDKGEKVTPPSPELKIKENAVRVKIGAENRVKVDILEGGNEYHVFSTDENVVTAEVVDKKIVLTGKSIGKAVVILSDEHSKYRKLPVSVYLTDQIKFNLQEVGIEVLAGHRKSAVINVSEGNGGYQVTSDNPHLKLSTTEDGKITIDAEAPKGPFTASVTVKDWGGVSASFPVKVTITKNAFPESLRDEVKAEDKVRYLFDGEDLMAKHVGDSDKEYRGGAFFYGWKYYNSFYFKLTFQSDLQVGKKTDATLRMHTRGRELAETKVELEIIKNDGKKVWGIFSFEKEGVVHYGSFCDGVVEKVDVPLKLEKNEVELKGDQETTVNITSGSGKYTIEYDKKDIVKVTATGNVLKIVKGEDSYEDTEEVNVTVTDVKTGKTESLLVKLTAEDEAESELKLEQETIEISGKAGEIKTVKVKILSGSGEYEIVSTSEDIKASVEGSTLVVTVTLKKEHAGGDQKEELQDGETEGREDAQEDGEAEEEKDEKQDEELQQDEPQENERVIIIRDTKTDKEIKVPVIIDVEGAK